MTKLIMKRAVRRSNDLESPENSRTSQGDTDVSSLVKRALERGKDVALKQAEKTASQNLQEISTADNSKLLERAMLWRQKILDPSYKTEASWDTEKVLEGGLEATSEPSNGGLEGIATSSLRSARPTSITDAPTSARQTNPAEYLRSDSAETEVELNNGDSKTTDPYKSDSGKSDLNLNLNSEPSNYFGSGQSGPAETNPKVITETPVLSPSVDPQATPEDTAQEPTEKGYSEKNRESPFPHDQPSVSGQERFSQHGTSGMPEVNMNVHPKMSGSSGVRWHVAMERRDTGDDGKDKNFKTKKKKKKNSGSTTKDPADSKSPIIVGGIIGGIFMLMAIVACVIQLW